MGRPLARCFRLLPLPNRQCPGIVSIAMGCCVRLNGAALPLIAMVASLNLTGQQSRGQRKMVAEDLFRVRQVGAIAWSPDGLYSALEFSTPGRTLDTSVPTNEIAILDLRTRALRSLTRTEADGVGFFNPAWSPDGRR